MNVKQAATVVALSAGALFLLPATAAHAGYPLCTPPGIPAPGSGACFAEEYVTSQGYYCNYWILVYVPDASVATCARSGWNIVDASHFDVGGFGSLDVTGPSGVSASPVIAAGADQGHGTGDVGGTFGAAGSSVVDSVNATVTPTYVAGSVSVTGLGHCAGAYVRVTAQGDLSQGTCVA